MVSSIDPIPLARVMPCSFLLVSVLVVVHHFVVRGTEAVLLPSTEKFKNFVLISRENNGLRGIISFILRVLTSLLGF